MALMDESAWRGKVFLGGWSPGGGGDIAVTEPATGAEIGRVGLASAATEVVSFANRPPRQAGTVVKDEGDGGAKAAEFLAAQKFI